MSAPGTGDSTEHDPASEPTDDVPREGRHRADVPVDSDGPAGDDQDEDEDTAETPYTGQPSTHEGPNDPGERY